MKNSEHWSAQSEAARTSIPIRFTIFLVKIFPHWFLTAVSFAVAFFYYLISGKARACAGKYQSRLIVSRPDCRIKKPSPYFQILSFAICLVEKIEGWCGKTKLSDVQFFDDGIVELKEQLSQGKGAYIIGAHLGNTEFIRSLASFGQTGVNKKFSVTAVMNMNVNANFTRSMSRMNGGFAFDVINADEIGIDTIEVLQQRIDEGGIVFITGDRTSANSSKIISRKFLGTDAAFPYGAFFLPSLLNAPVYYVFSERNKDITLKKMYNMHVIKSEINFDCSRAERKLRIDELCSEYVHHLENFCELYPYQWYNFFDFWEEDKVNND